MRKMLFLTSSFLIFFAIAYADSPTYYDQKGNYWYSDGNGNLYDNKGQYLYKRDDHASGSEDALFELGAVPSGAKSKTILSGDKNQKAGYYQTDSLSNAVRSLKEHKTEQPQKAEKLLDDKLKAAKLYKELVDAGYPPMEAWEGTLKDYGVPPPNDFGFVPERNIK